MSRNSCVFLAAVLAVGWLGGLARCDSPSAPDYTYIDYDSYFRLIDRIRASPLHGSVFRVTEDAFKKYDVKPVPYCKSKGKSVRCQSPIIELANFAKGDAFVQKLPTALLVGGFHGDEVIGTNSLYYMIELILENYSVDPYYANLFDNVHMMILPMANVNGFNRRSREEVNILDGRETSNDPNRDFPYDPELDAGCFKTSTSLVLDAIFRKNLVIGCITFHGGDNSVTYPWGNYPHEKNPKCGDHIAFSSVAEVLKSAGWNSPSMNVQTYTVGTMQDIVYNVRGGFEDWAYGASFDTSNIDKRCAVYDNPSVGLFKDKVEYDKLSNRAFVYLVEAGFSKIPDERFLGNSIPLKTKDYSLGKWGHVTRNINLALRFSQMMKPHSVILGLSYSDGLTVKAAVYGCINIDEVTSASGKMREMSREYDQRKNIWVLTLQFSVAAGLTRSLSFSIKCDKKFGDRTDSQPPQSHLVKLKTLPSYTVEYNGKHLTSYPTIDVTVLNVRTDLLQNGLIHWTANNINVVTYSQTLRASLPDVRKPTNEVVEINYSAEKVSYRSISATGTPVKKDVRVRKYGGQSPLRKPSERHLFTMSGEQEAQASLQFFLSMAGRDVDVYESGSSDPAYTSTLTFDNSSPDAEDRNALFIPEAGLNCRSANSDNDFYFVKVQASGKVVKTQMFTPANDYFTYKFGAFGGDLQRSGVYSLEERTLNRYIHEQTTTDLDDLRLLLRTFKLMLGGNQGVFSCVMVHGDPKAGHAKELKGASPTNTAIKPKAKQETHLIRLFGILLSVALFAALIYFLVKKHQERKRPFHEQPDQNQTDMDKLSFN